MNAYSVDLAQKPAASAVSCTTCSLGRLCLGRGIGSDDLDMMEDLVATRRKVKRNMTLIENGQKFDFLYAVRSGTLKSMVIDDSGAEQVVGFHLPGDIVGFDGIESGTHPVIVTAIEDCEVCAVRFSELEHAAASNSLVQRQFVRLMSREFTRRQGVTLLLGTMSAEERVVTFLLGLGARMAERGFSARRFVLRMTRAEIGSYLGLTIETVSRVLAKLSRRELIKVELKSIELLQMDELEAIAKRGLREYEAVC